MILFFWISLILVSLSVIGLLIRLIKGPSVPDRVVALDAIGISLVSIVALLSLIFETEFFLEVILLMSILAFIGTAAFAKFLERGEVFDRNSDR
ncbi:Na(+)/H(+) antiporter subunit F1 [Planococcus lenghuensis]|uniref:Na(+)/H(+) antiporter subunit F n=1 Tax=Planococcus lenghuensis TaxID=2213202 RepID=A0A1Q2KX65_9BACL|nr:Na(+)/H(+) antiporter subunit F1 [Planococcus lenghuensis]AQQ52716.1 Na(+)/H(+) antiporter subunit F [Planococcus lenghuensis]